MATSPEILKLTQSPTAASSDSLVLDTLRHLIHNRSAVAGLLIIGFFILIAVFAPQIATHDPILSMIGQPGESGRLPGKPPCIAMLGCTDAQHVMGLDLNARDVFSRIIYASRT